MKKTLAETIKQAGLVCREPVNLRAGEVSSYYVDVKKAYGDPMLFSEIIGQLQARLDKQTTCIAASGYGGLPLAAVLSLECNLPLILVRDTEKNHGRRGLIDGYEPSKGDFITIVDDVFTTGSSLDRTAATLRTTRASIIGCLVVVKRGYSDFLLPLDYLLTSDELM